MSTVCVCVCEYYALLYAITIFYLLSFFPYFYCNSNVMNEIYLFIFLFFGTFEVTVKWMWQKLMHFVIKENMYTLSSSAKYAQELCTALPKEGV